MVTHDSANPNVPSGQESATRDCAGGHAPPLLPPPLPSPDKKRGVRALPVIVTLACVAGLAIFVTAGLLVRAAIVAAREASPQPQVAAVRETRSEPAASSNARVRPAEPGVSYTNARIPRVPWSIHVLKIDRSQKDLDFYSAHAGTKVLGVSFLADQARGIPREIGRAIAGVNGDFYMRDNPTYAGDPRGLQIVNGDLISAPDTVCVWFDAQGNPHLDEVKSDFNVTWPDGRRTPFGLNEQRRSTTAVLYTPSYGASTRVTGGRELVLEREGDSPWLPLQASQTYRARVREVQTNGNTRLTAGTMVFSLGPRLTASGPEVVPGAVLQISTATTPELKGVKTAIAGGPAIIKDGKPFALKNPPPEAARNYSERSKYERHPRSAVGWSATHLYLVTVDGRQPGLSVGIKLAELAEYMAGLGCTEAMNLDGGKSAQMWLSGQIVNDPCQGVDTVANSFFVVRKPEAR